MRKVYDLPAQRIQSVLYDPLINKKFRKLYFQIKDRIISSNDRILFADDRILSVNDRIRSVKIAYFQPGSYCFRHDRII